MDVLGPLGKAQLTVDDDPPVPFWDALEHKKWGLRKAALDKVKELGSTPRLAAGDYGELCRHMRKILQKDAIVPVAAAAADVCAVLASGLRDNFTAHAKVRCGRGGWLLATNWAGLDAQRWLQNSGEPAPARLMPRPPPLPPPCRAIAFAVHGAAAAGAVQGEEHCDEWGQRGQPARAVPALRHAGRRG